MQNKRVLTVSLTGLLLVAAGVTAQVAKTVSSGKDIYTKKCASCHGKQGEGVAKMATMLKAKIRNLAEAPAPPETLAVWKKIVADGKGKMPAYKAKLTAAEIDSVITYVHTLTKPATPKTEPAEKAGTGTDSTKGAIK
jgi:mono/diheme cytochrome c family protein